ncbi:hypothetical protein Q8G39_28515, partial [Klebsiella pneumoniae]|uniref:hypothetical protein n=1 Tax=Klebsiella pneumoniae TaxID=573 RepID=UPI0030132D93
TMRWRNPLNAVVGVSLVGLSTWNTLFFLKILNLGRPFVAETKRASVSYDKTNKSTVFVIQQCKMSKDCD